MIKPSRRRLRIAALDDDGAGVGALEADGAGPARELHVPFALPGEEVVAEVEHESPHRPAAWGRLVELLTRAPERVEPACPAWGRCGGCPLSHLGYPHQLAWKRARVEAALRRAGVDAPVAACAAPLPDAPRPYRNRSKLVFARDGADGTRVILGAYAPRSHRVVDLAGCRAVIPPLDAVATSLARLAGALGVVPYDEPSGAGDARYALLRATRDGATQVMVVVARRGGHGIAELARRLCAEHPEVRGVVENLQTSRGNALIGDLEPDRVLAGDPDLVARVGAGAGVALRLSPQAFFQASWPGADLLYERAIDLGGLRAGERALDLYSGAGGIALLAARRAPGASVVGVEEVAAAVEDAEAARAQEGLGNLRFVNAEVAHHLATSPAGARADVVFVDPPRRGLAPGVVEALARHLPRRIVYLSCDPDTLARDLALLMAHRYRPGPLSPIDLMPDTAHIEVAVALDRSPQASDQVIP